MAFSIKGTVSTGLRGSVVKPSVPGKPTATLSVTTITVSWSAVSGATAYNVVCSTGGLAAQNDLTGTTAIFTGTAGTTYAFTVAAKNAGGTSAASTASDNVTLTPATPGKPTATASATTITVSWSAVSGATAYNVVCSTGGLADQNDLIGTTATYTGTAGTTYAFTVAAKNAGGTSAASTASDNVVLTPAVPSAPTATASGTTITVSWSAVAGATAYNVVCSKGGLADKNNLTGTSTTFTGTAGTTYAFTVAAKNSGGTSAASTASGDVVVSLAAPSAPTATASGTTITVSWTAVTGATAYNVVCSKGGLTAQNDLTGTSTTFTGVVGTTYAFTVAAKNSGGTSSASTASNDVNIAPPFSTALAYVNFDQSTTVSSNTELVSGTALGTSPVLYYGSTSISVSTSQYKSYPNSIYFSGGQSLAVSFTIPTTSAGFSYSLWFYVTDNGGSNNPRIVQSSIGDGGAVYYGSGGTTLNQGLGSYSLNTWYHLAYSCSITNNTQQYYLDAVAKGSGSNPGYQVNVASYISLGNKKNETQDSFIGYFDDIQIFNNPLTVSQVTFLKNNPGLRVKNGFLWSAYYNYFGGTGFMDSGLVGTAGAGASTLTLIPINSTWGSNTYTAISQNRGYTTDMSSLLAATSNIINNGDITGVTRHNFSVEWLGYFCPNATGNWKFSLISDDASYLWIDNDTNTYATTGYKPSNADVNYGNDHGMDSIITSGNIPLTKDKYYLIRIQFGENGGGYDIRVGNIPPGGASSFNFAGLVYPFMG